MNSMLKKLFGKKKGKAENGKSVTARKEKLLEERERLQHELSHTKIVSPEKREEMLERIETIEKTLYNNFKIK